MNKLKKVIVGIGIFICGLATKVLASDMMMTVSMYAVDPGPKQVMSKSWKLVIPFILFFIGVFVILSKKITRKVKAIVVSILIALAIFSVILMNYLSTIM